MKGRDMSTVALYREYRDFDLRRVHIAPRAASPAPRRGLFRRILAAIARSHRRRLEDEAGHFIATHGGRLTDDVERQLSEHFNGRGSPPYAAGHPFRPFGDL
jgi:hypothetical protein